MADLIAHVQNNFIGAWNAHDAAGVLQTFAEDAQVTLEPPFPGAPPLFTGIAQVEGFVGTFISGIHVDARNFRTADNRVYFDATVSADALRQAGLEAVDQNDELILENGKIKLFAIRFTPDTIVKLDRIRAQMPQGL